MDKCFIIMPISTPKEVAPRYSEDRDHFKHVLEQLIIPAVKDAGLEPVPPIVQGADIIQGEIIKNLETASVVLCDMSILNPNVFFELGIRTALDKPVCLIKDEVTEKIPFDTGIINHHTYNSGLQSWVIKDEIAKLTLHLKKSIENSKSSTSLWKYFSLSMRAEPSKEVNSVDGKLELLIAQFEAMRHHLEAITPAISTKSRFNDPSELALRVFIEDTYNFKPLFVMRTGNNVLLGIKKGVLDKEGKKHVQETLKHDYGVTCLIFEN